MSRKWRTTFTRWFLGGVLWESAIKLVPATAIAGVALVTAVAEHYSFPVVLVLTLVAFGVVVWIANGGLLLWANLQRRRIGATPAPFVAERARKGTGEERQWGPSRYAKAGADTVEGTTTIGQQPNQEGFKVETVTDSEGVPRTRLVVSDPVPDPPLVRFGAIRTTTVLSRGGAGDVDMDVYRIPISLKGRPGYRVKVCATLRFDWVRRPNAFRGLWSSAPPNPECIELATDGVERELDVLNVIPESNDEAQVFHVPYWQDGQAGISIPRERQDFELELALGDRTDISRWSLLPGMPSREWSVRPREP